MMLLSEGDQLHNYMLSLSFHVSQTSDVQITLNIEQMLKSDECLLMAAVLHTVTPSWIHYFFFQPEAALRKL